MAVGERAQKRSGNFSAAMKDLSGEEYWDSSHPSLLSVHNWLSQMVEIISNWLFFSLQANILCLP